jgi:transposase, IS5 family
MRKKRQEQMSLFHALGSNDIAKELGEISLILDANPQLLDYIYSDLTKGSRVDTGAEGMTAEQVLRAAVLKQSRQLTYRELAFHLEDSKAFRAFTRLEMGYYPGFSTLQDNIIRISSASWNEIHKIIIRATSDAGVETGRKIRVDATSVLCAILKPSDSSLLRDGVRIITRWLWHGKRFNLPAKYEYADHRRVMKKRFTEILNSKKEETRFAAYKEQLKYARRVCGYAESALPIIEKACCKTTEEQAALNKLVSKIKNAQALLLRVIDQTERRVLKKESVPSGNKVTSFFESHTDIIVKKNRETSFGHKVVFTSGRSNLILDCLMERGNPADTEQLMSMLNRQKEIYGRMPRQVATDGGYASKDNLTKAKEAGIKDVAFSKKRGLAVLDMVKSIWVYKQLKNFRAGIEANISALKRAFGLRRCNWSGWEGFQQYVWSAVVSYNLLVLARIKLKVV